MNKASQKIELDMSKLLGNSGQGIVMVGGKGKPMKTPYKGIVMVGKPT